MEDFFNDLILFYKQNKRKVNKNIHFSNSNCEVRIREFCSGFDGNLNYVYLCGFAYILLETTQKPLPDFIYGRLVLGDKNQYVQEYIDELNKINSNKSYFNFLKFHKSKFKNKTLQNSGRVGRVAFK